MSSELPAYNVHLYALVRVKVLGVLAESQIEAIDVAIEAVDLHALFDRPGGPGDIEYVEYAEDVPSAVVDECGDDQFERSGTYDSSTGTWQKVDK